MPSSQRLFCALLAAAAFGFSGAASAQAPKPAYEEAPMAQYRVASVAEEIALARGAAPASVSDDAEILVLGERGYDTAVKGKNGFVCLVERAWASGFNDPEFWNPKERAPICLSAASVRSVLPAYLRRTQWVLAGASKAQIVARTQAEVAAGTIGPPEVSAMSYMMSKSGYLNDADGHWHPHIMLFLPPIAPSEWGANEHNEAVQGVAGATTPMTIIFIPTPQWSDGTPAPLEPTKM